MAVGNITFISGMTLSFAQTATLIEYFLNEEENHKMRNSKCSKVRRNYTNLLKYDVKDILNINNNNDTDDVKKPVVIKTSDDLESATEAYYDLMKALSSDVDKFLGLTFRHVYADVFEHSDITSVIGYSGSNIKLSNRDRDFTSLIRIGDLSCRDLVMLKLSLAFDKDQMKLMTPTFSMYGVGDGCSHI
jgi:hypothetical protein